MEAAVNGTGRLHLLGLLSDGGIHTYDKACHELIAMAKDHGVKQVFIHIISDGRDVPPKSLTKYTQVLENKIQDIGLGTIATLQGRWWAMDRDNRWERVEAAYKLIILGESLQKAESLDQAIEAAYARDETE